MVEPHRRRNDRDGAGPRRVLLQAGALLAARHGAGGAAGLPLVVGLSGAGLLGACSPAFDWREAHSEGDELRMLLPGRPSYLTRQIHLREVAVAMTMTGAEARGLAFTVAIARPAANATLPAPALLDAMREQMLRNILAGSARTRDVKVPVVDAAGRPATAGRGEGEALEVRARGSGPHEAIGLLGRFFVARGLPAQAVVVGRDFSDEAAAQFVDSLRIVQVGA